MKKGIGIGSILMLGLLIGAGASFGGERSSISKTSKILARGGDSSQLVVNQNQYFRPAYVPGEVIVKFKAESKSSDVGLLAKKHGGTHVRKLKIRGKNVHLMKMPSNITEEEYIAQLKKDSNVEYVERNGYMYTCETLPPDDEYYSQQWNLNNTGQSYPIPGGSTESGTSDADIDLPEAWNEVNQAFSRLGDPNIVVAVIDTGVDLNHPDLSDSIGTGGYAGYDFVNDDSIPQDDNGHGTHVAGIIAGIANNDIGVSGVAPGCTIMPIKVMNAYGSGTFVDIAEGVDYAADPNHPADIINMSLGGAYNSETLANAITNAHEAGCTIIVAAGNGSAYLDENPHYPACYEETIAVSATDSNDDPASFAAYGDAVDIAAPGVKILSLRAAGTGNADRFVPYGDPNAILIVNSGTSMASPCAAGLAALCLSYTPNMTNEEIRVLLRKTADDLGDVGEDDYYGAGRINAYAAISLISEVPDAAGNPTPQNDVTGVNVNTVNLSWTASAGALSQDVYFGTSYAAVDSADPCDVEFVGNQTDDFLTMDGIRANTDYYWRVDERNPQGVTKGTVWHFETGINEGYIYVDCDAAGNDDGTSWTDAFDTIQEGINAAQNGDTIIVAEGTYGETVDFGGKAITVQSTDPNNWNVVEATIIDGGNSRQGVIFDSSETSSSVLEGMTIANCYVEDEGAGIYCSGTAAPTIRWCVIRDNVADGGGAALYLGGVSYPPANRPSRTISHCRIYGNESDEGVGAVWVEYSSSTWLNCLIYDNDGYDGGFMYQSGETMTVINCTIANNSASMFSGGITLLGGTATLDNSIFWANNSGSGLWIYGATLNVNYCDLQNGQSFYKVNTTLNWNNSISSDPCFINSANDNYHILPGSPCKDAGNNSYVSNIDYDLDRDVRILDGTVDIGMDEVASKVLNYTQDTWHTTIQSAIDAAVSDDVLIIYPGVYAEQIDFDGKAITVRSTDPDDWEIVKNTIINPGFSPSNPGCVVLIYSGEGSDSVLEGLTITGGYASGSDSSAFAGGILAIDSSPTIQKCYFKDNFGNGAGGIYFLQFYVGYTSPVVRHCIFNGNVSAGDGGAIFASDNDSLILENNLFVGNSAGGRFYAGYGGAVYCGNVISAAIRNCTFVNNDLSSSGGRGGALCTENVNSAVTVNCIFWGNTLTSPYAIYNTSSSSNVVSYSDIEGGSGAVYGITYGTGNINSTPNFADSELYHIASNSPCIDAGYNAVVNWNYDFDGDNRIIDGNSDSTATVDMGWDEYEP